MTFSTALDLIKCGVMVSREAWDNAEFYIYLYKGFDTPILIMHTDDENCPKKYYRPSIEDLLSEDWYIVC